MSLVYELEFERQPVKFIKKQDRVAQKRILDAIDGIRSYPPQGDVKKMKGYDLWRLRIGYFRVLFSVDHDERVIVIDTIGNRGDVY